MGEKTKRTRIGEEVTVEETSVSQEEVETTELDSTQIIAAYKRYFELCEKLDTVILTKEQLSELNDELEGLEKTCKFYLNEFTEITKNI